MAKFDPIFAAKPFISANETRIWSLFNDIYILMNSTTAEIKEMKKRNYV